MKNGRNKERDFFSGVSPRGFTLVELLIASSIFAIVMVGVYSSFRAGVFGYRHIDKDMEFLQTETNVLWRINKDLRNIFIFSEKETKFIGKKDYLALLTEADFYQNHEIKQNVAFVSYQLAQDRLMRLCRWGKDSLTQEALGSPQEMWSGIKELRFSYAVMNVSDASMTWQDSWEEVKSLPHAIKIIMTFNDLSQEPLEYVVYLP